MAETQSENLKETNLESKMDQLFTKVSERFAHYSENTHELYRPYLKFVIFAHAIALMFSVSAVAPVMFTSFEYLDLSIFIWPLILNALSLVTILLSILTLKKFREGSGLRERYLKAVVLLQIPSLSVFSLVLGVGVLACAQPSTLASQADKSRADGSAP